jgi:hypothetical protein
MDEIESLCIDLGEQEVAIVHAGLSYRLRYVLLSIVAWAVAIIDFDPSGDAPRRPRRVVIRDKSNGDVLYEDGVFYGDDADAVAREFADDIRRVGIGDFVYKKSRGWRID